MLRNHIRCKDQDIKQKDVSPTRESSMTDAGIEPAIS